MPSLIPLLLALWALIGGQAQLYQLQGPVNFTDLYGSPRVAEAATGCTAAKPQVWISAGAPLETVVHEFAHAYDCLDDGLMNDSPSLRPAQRPDWVSDYCWQSEAEWYACSVVYYGNARPYLVAPWGAEAIAHAAVATEGASTMSSAAGTALPAP